MRACNMSLAHIFLLKDNIPTKPRLPSSPYQKPLKSVVPPLIPTEDEQENQEEGFLGNSCKAFSQRVCICFEILGKKHSNYQNQSQQKQQHKHSIGFMFKPLKE
ncbi:hypothetical protein RchiOBHm_Chr5g0006981 [Rosa chinensis]|uniref:Uncharacterized protein n=1 Tax=Rosa chinensis TaxID=74649 RepID=A0A2P6Q3P1_ROSCH|nr:hypothetical protein RchiOBHm_Chr5g0006981 [Rosa chinensis]